jgi:hypothetical protein
MNIQTLAPKAFRFLMLASASLALVSCGKGERTAASTTRPEEAPPAASAPARDSTTATTAQPENVKTTRGGFVRFPDGTTRRFDTLSGVELQTSLGASTVTTFPGELYFEEVVKDHNRRVLTVPLSKVAKFTFKRRLLDGGKEPEYTLETVSTSGKAETFHPYWFGISASWSGTVASQFLYVQEMTVEFDNDKK